MLAKSSTPISESITVDKTRLTLSIRIPTKANRFQVNFLSNNEPHQSFGFFSFGAQNNLRLTDHQCISNPRPQARADISIKSNHERLNILAILYYCYLLVKELEKGRNEGENQALWTNGYEIKYRVWIEGIERQIPIPVWAFLL